MNDLPASARRVADAATHLGLNIMIRLMEQTTRTAEDAAAACGCDVGQIVKSLIFKGKESETPYLILVSGANRVNEKKLAGHIGEKAVRPDADYVRSVTGFAIGGIPPFGHDRPLVPYFDSDLFAFGTVWAAAGTPNAVFEVDPRRLRDALDAPVIDVG